MMTRQGRFTKLLLAVTLLALFSRWETFAFHHGGGGSLITSGGGGHNCFSCARLLPPINNARLTFVHGVTNRVHYKDPRGRRRYRSSSSLSPSALFQIPKPDSSSYSDDCFGLLSLVGGTATMDVVFVGIFVILSAIAATLTSTGSIPANRRVPGVVAGLTLACTLAVSLNSNLLSSSSLTEMLAYTHTTADINPNALLIEIALCSISIIYSLLDDPNPVDGNKR